MLQIAILQASSFIEMLKKRAVFQYVFVCLGAGKMVDIPSPHSPGKLRSIASFVYRPCMFWLVTVPILLPVALLVD